MSAVMASTLSFDSATAINAKENYFVTLLSLRAVVGLLDEGPGWLQA
jgi:hypothetical protein